jgi:hypothetical protein
VLNGSKPCDAEIFTANVIADLREEIETLRKRVGELEAYDDARLTAIKHLRWRVRWLEGSDDWRS